jgi:hypothetical protein
MRIRIGGKAATYVVAPASAAAVPTGIGANIVHSQ